MTEPDEPIDDAQPPETGIVAADATGVGSGTPEGADTVRLVKTDPAAASGGVRLEKSGTDARVSGPVAGPTSGWAPGAAGTQPSSVDDAFAAPGWSDHGAPVPPPVGPGATAYGAAPSYVTGPVPPRGRGATGLGSAAAGTVPLQPGPMHYPAVQGGVPPRRSPVLVVVAVVIACLLLAAVGGIWWLATGGPGDDPASVAESSDVGTDANADPGATGVASSSPTASPTPTRVVQPSAETVWANLLEAQAPRLCGMAPGRFSDGVAGGSGGQAWLAWRLPGGDGLSVQQSTAFVDVTGDGIDDVAVVEQCNTGGDAWFDYIVFYEVQQDGAVRLLDGIGLVSVTSTARAYFDGFVAASDGVVVLVNAGNGSIDDLSPWRAELGWTGSTVQVRYASPV
ncbi:hypothetical protein F8O01_10005 [Pseudoclavibacter chungangensis]|uniref:Uncharacterized protein n=1 Tax=Pseudoclavibacter chungangensis TaxID=587635 RepID=A0A7J5BQY6_9MICO|nr:hypothetical protein [Pseudoclavibacter chungangensis]KAB1656711.1 hypothetical protein F8O01_10005 [Pseudoclavibacter chungangensis]NYJ67835.1 hypothetical protein [Pseudoclavibacter chungangensis]